MKILKVAMAVVLLIGSFKAMAAGTVDTRVVAVQINQIDEVKAQVDELINQLGDRGTLLQENHLGQYSFVADSLVQAAHGTDDLEKINSLWLESQGLAKEIQAIKVRLGVK